MSRKILEIAVLSLFSLERDSAHTRTFGTYYVIKNFTAVLRYTRPSLPVRRCGSARLMYGSLPLANYTIIKIISCNEGDRDGKSAKKECNKKLPIVQLIICIPVPILFFHAFTPFGSKTI